MLEKTSDVYDSADYTLTNTADLLIGMGQQDSFTGLIDEVAVFNKAFAVSDVRRLMLGLHPLG